MCTGAAELCAYACHAALCGPAGAMQSCTATGHSRCSKSTHLQAELLAVAIAPGDDGSMPRATQVRGTGNFEVSPNCICQVRLNKLVGQGKLVDWCYTTAGYFLHAHQPYSWNSEGPLARSTFYSKYCRLKGVEEVVCQNRQRWQRPRNFHSQSLTSRR